MLWFSRKVPKQTVFLFEVFKTCYASIEHKGFLAYVFTFILKNCIQINTNG